jgi:hypothetical protein
MSYFSSKPEKPRIIKPISINNRDHLLKPIPGLFNIVLAVFAMDTGSSNFHGDGDDVDLDIRYTDDFARDQPDEAVKWLSKYGVRGSPDHSQADSCQYQYLSLEESKCIRLLVLCPSP